MASSNAARSFWIAVLWISYITFIINWFVILGGIGSTQEACEQLVIARARGVLVPQPFDLWLVSTRNAGCDRVFRGWWWIWVYQLLIFFMPLSLIREGIYYGQHIGWIGILSVAAILNMTAANGALILSDYFSPAFQAIQPSRTKTAASGFAISAAMNLLMIFGLAGAATVHQD